MSKLAHSNEATMNEIEARKALEDQTMEREANAFAMELLMPTKFLLADLEKLGPFDIEDDRPIEALAKKYKVSRNVMLLRIVQLKEKAI